MVSASASDMADYGDVDFFSDHRLIADLEFTAAS